MIKIGTVTCTPEAADMVAQCYSSFPTPTEGRIRLIDTYVSTEGITKGDTEYKAFSIFEYDDADESLIQEFLEKRFAAFSKIPGVTYKIEDWVRVADALKMLADGEFNTDFTNTGF
ncbi:MAG: hypothetical protein HQK73_12215 [Desulfamplus sp.]|nr:hypothetical protein [Desulfamplus sp.]